MYLEYILYSIQIPLRSHYDDYVYKKVILTFPYTLVT